VGHDQGNGKKARTNAAKKAKEEVLLSWTVHLLKERPKQAAIVLPLSVFAVGFAFYWGKSLVWAVIAVVLLLGSLSSFIFPLKYELTTEEVRIHNPFSGDVKRWVKFRSYTVFPDAVFLSYAPRGRNGRRGGGGGLTLYFGNHKEEVMAVITDQVITDEELEGS